MFDCSVLFYAAVIEYACGVVDRGMTEGEPILGECSNEGCITLC